MATKSLRLLTLLLRVVACILALFILAVSAFHERRIDSKGLSPSGNLYAIIVIAGVAVIWSFLTIIGSCLFPSTFFGAILIVDTTLTGGFIAIAILLRNAAGANCSNDRLYSRGAGSLWSTTGSAYTNQPSLNCKLDKTAFAVAVANSVFFAVLAFMSYRVYSHYRKNRAFGPGPQNGYSVDNNIHSKSKHNRYSNDTAITEPDYDTPAGAHGYRAPVPEDNARVGGFDPSLPHAGYKERHAAL